MDKFEQSAKDLVETNLRFEQFRLEMIQQIAILKVSTFLQGSQWGTKKGFLIADLFKGSIFSGLG